MVIKISSQKTIKVAIVDYGMGNLFSVKHMCNHVGIQAEITSSKQKILAADAIILPGVGAFGDAMDTLKTLGLVKILRDVASSNKPFFGICLGMQLLMTKSYEFGEHKGLNIIKGSVVRLNKPMNGSVELKVPHVCWNRIWMPNGISTKWSESFLNGLPNGEFMYFVHSFYAKPEDDSVVLSITKYGNLEFCSSFQYQNIFACQFHPERSGPQGMLIYRNLAALIKSNSKR